ncbi:MAG: hypothetical protein NTW30_06255 [Candidatus Aenigmarchaeota archaeon]|nr:hypothetical protein [Candidatus Aenigmarchaeota archaeon]
MTESGFYGGKFNKEKVITNLERQGESKQTRGTNMSRVPMDNVQKDYNTGNNGVNNLTGLQNTKLQTYGKLGPVGNMFRKIGRVFGVYADESRIGDGIDPQTLFQDSMFKKDKSGKATEVTQCNDTKGMKLITSEKPPKQTDSERLFGYKDESFDEYHSDSRGQKLLKKYK